ncbi:cell division regulator GpsB [Cerasibacillus terrae]|uniref:Cell division regulator GpsB n=1 Tax=Cerasibacillus terrae TaxID=2498845 RepID=A0A5C8P3I4_9BACI|nr:cell division regulator GpsB [Cerasibacillus terrae]TXL67827.1 cell division regulator GpsB [Cerasibacillus terrae]
MDKDKIQLTGKDILEKDFKVSMRGYNQDEVDKFLDIIIQDYQLFQQEISKLHQEINQLKNNKRMIKPNQVTQPSQVNYDVLKRLSNLEKAVFGGQLKEE